MPLIQDEYHDWYESREINLPMLLGTTEPEKEKP